MLNCKEKKVESKPATDVTGYEYSWITLLLLFYWHPRHSDLPLFFSSSPFHSLSFLRTEQDCSFILVTAWCDTVIGGLRSLSFPLGKKKENNEKGKKKHKGKKKKIVIIHSFMNPPPLNVHYLNQQQLQVQRGLEGQQPA